MVHFEIFLRLPLPLVLEGSKDAFEFTLECSGIIVGRCKLKQPLRTHLSDSTDEVARRQHKLMVHDKLWHVVECRRGMRRYNLVVLDSCVSTSATATRRLVRDLHEKAARDSLSDI